MALARSFEFKLPLALLLATPISSAKNSNSTLAATKLRVRIQHLAESASRRCSACRRLDRVAIAERRRSDVSESLRSFADIRVEILYEHYAVHPIFYAVK